MGQGAWKEGLHGHQEESREKSTGEEETREEGAGQEEDRKEVLNNLVP